MSKAERALIIVLRAVGVVCLLATFAVVMPRAWMAAIHEWVGLGRFPDAPIAEYLARSASALYAFHGGLFLLISMDVRRYAAVLTYAAIAAIVFGPTLLVVGLSAGMPLHWTLQEGPFVLALGVCLLGLQARAKAAERQNP